MRLTFSFYVFIIFLLAACAKEISQEDLIQAAVELKMKEWEESQMEACKKEIMAKAETYVDSILIVLSLEYKLDTIPKPEKPVKPLKPAFKVKPDTVVVDQLNKNEK